LPASHGNQLNEYIHWHVEEGRKLTGPYLSRIEENRTALYQRLCGFQIEYEFFILSVNQVLPFDVNSIILSRLRELRWKTISLV
jgi:amidase